MDELEESFRAELDGSRLPSWRAPFHWWGPAWARPDRRSLIDLVHDGVLEEERAEGLRRHVATGGSVVVAAGPSGVGKSTLADALADRVSEGTARVYVRGSYETFDFVDQVTVSRAALLVNEMSPHLPIYLWGRAARRVLEMAHDGAQVIGTIHADAPEEVVYQLARQPVGASPDEIAALGMLVFLTPSSSDVDALWQVGRVVQLRATGQGVRVEDVD